MLFGPLGPTWFSRNRTGAFFPDQNFGWDLVVVRGVLFPIIGQVRKGEARTLSATILSRKCDIPFHIPFHPIPCQRATKVSAPRVAATSYCHPGCHANVVATCLLNPLFKLTV